jgi:bleomycin hydrolase
MKKIVFSLLCISFVNVWAQDTLSFDKIVQWDANPVESQGRTGTCWSYSAASFLESELIRMNKGSHNLSEIFIARQVYLNKADNYVRRHGKAQFGEGSLGHDLLNAVDAYGMVPNEVFDGLKTESEVHNHAELASILEAYVKAVVSNKGKQLTPLWEKGYSSLLDVYLGEYPESFTYNGKNYTPQSFAASLGIKAENYITLTSYTHRTFYSDFILRIPDNWDNGSFYNIPLDELLETTKEALRDGYTIEWDADVSNEGFNSKEGIAVSPLKDEEPNFELTAEEMDVTQELRQENFDNYTVTDDHLMHIVGLVKGVDGKEYFVVKNSWGDERGLEDYKGHVLVSEAYFKMNTISVLLHKDALSNGLKRKLKI